MHSIYVTLFLGKQFSVSKFPNSLPLLTDKGCQLYNQEYRHAGIEENGFSL